MKTIKLYFPKLLVALIICLSVQVISVQSLRAEANMQECADEYADDLDECDAWDQECMDENLDKANACLDLETQKTVEKFNEGKISCQDNLLQCNASYQECLAQYKACLKAVNDLYKYEIISLILFREMVPSSILSKKMMLWTHEDVQKDIEGLLLSSDALGLKKSILIDLIRKFSTGGTKKKKEEG